MGRRRTAYVRAAACALSVTLIIGASIAPASAAPPRPERGFGTSGDLARVGTRGRINVADAAKHQRGPSRPTTELDLPRPGGAKGQTDGTQPPIGIAAFTPPVQATTTDSPPIAQPGFNGLSTTSGPDTNVEPPDPWVAVGPDHVVQTTNVSMRITNRVGGASTSIDLFSFFQLPAGAENTDPRVHFDSVRGRWIVTEVSWICMADDGNAYGYLDLMISDTADPTGDYTLWYWEFTGYLPDFAALGGSSDKLAWGSNVYVIPSGYPSNCMSQPGADFYGADMLFFDWADLLAKGGPNGFIDTSEFFNGAGGFSTPRVAMQVPASSPGLDLILEWSDGFQFNPYYVKVVGSAVADTIDIASEGDLVDFGILAPWGAVHKPFQPGPDVVTESIDSRPTDAVAQGSRLIFVSNEECLPEGALAPYACVRVTELNTSGADFDTPPSMTQDFYVTELGRDNYFGGIGLAGNGTLGVVWTASSVTAGDYPSSYAAYQLPGDGPNTLSAPELLKAGTGLYQGDRWGDYVGVAQDPQVPNALWQANQYSAGANGWRTWVSQLQTGGSSYVPINPVRVLDSRPAYNIGLSGVFSANVPRTWDVAGFEVNGNPVIPDDAVAVTGNFVVVNQTAGGYATVTPTPNNNPPTSSLNFPLGDTRANNVTIPLSATGSLSAVFKAPAGRTTHFIFDVTGYFVAGDAEATYATITPVRVLDSRAAYSIGLTGRFFANTPRTLSIAGANGIPADAVAVTANLAVVGQTRAGYVAVTPNPQANPPTATMNFPLGDVRANGLTARLNNEGDLSIVYKAPAGHTVDFVLDVTGFYRNIADGLLFFPLTPGRIMETRPGFVLSRLTGQFIASIPRTLSANGHFGIPDAGVGAITGNLSIVGQTAGGYAVITPNPDANPRTATINFPLGDVRGNGVTVPLNGSYDLSFVYKAPANHKTHMILDVTGYFR